MLVDTHCHLNYPYDEGKTIDDLIREADRYGVKTLITIATEAANFNDVRAIAEKYNRVFFTLGVHPHEGETVSDEVLARIRTEAQHPKCVAIGEIGLDYYYEHSAREAQQRAFERQLEIARDLDLPVVIHSRDGETDLLPRLAEHVSLRKSSRPPGVIHCFSGSYDFGKACLDLGFYLSLSGIITFKKSDELRDAVKRFPLNRLCVETDAPFLAPVPFRGKKGEPFMTRATAEKLAEIHGTPFAEVARITTENAKTVFGV